MITKKTAYEICLCYDEIVKAKKLVEELEEQRRCSEPMNLRDSFGRQRGFQLGVPNGESSHRLLNVAPILALAVIHAHIAEESAELVVLNERARLEILETQ